VSAACWKADVYTHTHIYIYTICACKHACSWRLIDSADGQLPRPRPRHYTADPRIRLRLSLGWLQKTLSRPIYFHAILFDRTYVRCTQHHNVIQYNSIPIRTTCTVVRWLVHRCSHIAYTHRVKRIALSCTDAPIYIYGREILIKYNITILLF